MHTTTTTPRQTAQGQIAEWLEKMARIGFFTKGVLYGTLGILAVMAAVGSGGQVGGSKGAIARIAQQPFGNVLLYIVAFGLAAYALWKAVSVIFDPEQEGSDAKGIAKRFGAGLSAVVHGALAVAAFQMTQAGGQGSRGSWIATIMSEGSWGRWAVFGLGLFIIVAGFSQVKQAADKRFQRRLKTGSMKRELRKAVVKFGRAGFAARGVVLCVIGFMAAKAALQYDMGQQVGVGPALEKLSAQTGGTILLAVVAAGLAAYGAYMIVASRYRAIPARS